MRACQALASTKNEPRFIPNCGMKDLVHRDSIQDQKRSIAHEQISQVWFAGVHSNVGGGYPDDALAYIPLVWMLNEARRCGLKFKSETSDPPAYPDAFKNAISRRTRMGESTIRARASAPITVTVHVSSCNFATTDIRKKKTTKSRSNVRKFTKACSGASGTMRTPMRPSACPPSMTS